MALTTPATGGPPWPRMGRVAPAALIIAILVAGLGARFGVHMLQVARKGEHRDFAAVYTAAFLFRHGEDFYDPQPGREHFGANQNPALVRAARELGTLHRHEEFDHVHVFSYPPLTVLPFVPFTLARFRPAAVAWQLLSLGFLGASVLLLRRAVPLSGLATLATVGILLLYEPLENSLGLGQINLLILFLLCAFFAAYRAGRDPLAALALGAAIGFRLHPALLLLYLARRREWRLVAGTVGVSILLAGVALVIVGLPAHQTYLGQVAPKYARAFAGLGNHSLSGLVINLGAGMAPGVPIALWRTAGQVLSLLLLAGVLLAIPPGGGGRGGEGRPLEFALMLAAMLLVIPNTTINHLVFALVPFAVLLEHLVRQGGDSPAWAWGAAGVAYVAIGAIDDYYAHPLLEQGPAVLAAGIKTYGVGILLLALLRLRRERALDAGHGKAG